MMMFEFFISICMLHQVGAIPRGICRTHRKYQSACQNIFIFNREELEFMSLLNETYKVFSRQDYVDMKKNTTRIVAHSMMPYITCDNDSRKVGGYVGDLWNIIQEKHQFKYTLKCVPYFVGQNMTENGDADVFLSASVAEEDLVNSYFSQPYFYNWYHLYLRAPELQASSLSYLKTFSTNLWLLMASIFILLTVTLWLNSKIINHIVKMEPNVSMPSCFLSAISGFINQGHDLRLRSLSGRGQVLVSLFFGVVLYAAMNAVLFSRLAITNVKFPFSSLWDISQKSGLSLCLRKNSFVHETIMTRDGKILPEWKGILNNDNCLDIIDQRNISKIICERGVIIFENRVVMSALAKRSAFPCDVVNFDAEYFQKGNIFMMARALKEKRLIEKIMMEIRSYGIFKRLETEHITSRKSSSIGGQVWNQVTMGHIRGILIMYFAAILISLAILLVEIALHSSQQ